MGQNKFDIQTQLSLNSAQFDQKLYNTQNKLNEFSKKGVTNTQDSLKGLSSTIIAGAAAFGLGFTAIQGFKVAFGQIDSLGDSFTKTMQEGTSSTKSLFNTIISGNFSNLIFDFKRAAKAGADFASAMDEISDKRIALAFKEASTGVEYERLSNIMRNTSSSEAERAKASARIIELESQLLNEKKALGEDSYKVALERIAAERNVSTKELEMYVTRNAEFIAILEDANTRAEALKKTLFAPSGQLEANYNLFKKLSNITDEERTEILKNYQDIQQAQKEFYTNIGKAERTGDKLTANKDRTPTPTGLKPIKGVGFDGFKTAIKDPLEAIDVKKLEAYTEASYAARLATQNLQYQFELLDPAIVSSFENINASLADGADSFEQYGQQVLGTIRNVIAGYIGDSIGAMIAGQFKFFASLGPIGIPLGLAAAAAAKGVVTTAFSSMIPSFADGGIAYGETYARVGEYAGASANPEVIAPLNKLKAILGNQNQGFNGEVEFKIKGDTLVAVLNNHSKRKSFSN